MSGSQPPVTCADFKRVLRSLDFASKPGTGSSHEQWTGSYAGERRLVTVDCPKAPFHGWLLSVMLKQLGMSKKVFYEKLRNL